MVFPTLWTTTGELQPTLTLAQGNPHCKSLFKCHAQVKYKPLAGGALTTVHPPFYKMDTWPAASSLNIQICITQVITN